MSECNLRIKQSTACIIYICTVCIPPCPCALVNHAKVAKPPHSVSRPTNLPPNLPLINIPGTPPRLAELDIAPAHIAHPPRPADAAPARSRLLVVLNDPRLRPPTAHQSAYKSSRNEKEKKQWVQRSGLNVPVLVGFHVPPLVAVRG
jgi:hypothetical protein